MDIYLASKNSGFDPGNHVSLATVEMVQNFDHFYGRDL